MNSAQQQRIKVFKDTLKQTKGIGSYKQSIKYKAVDLPSLSEILDESEDSYRDLNKENVVVEVCNQDTLVAALELHNEGLQPIILNMASDFKAGGGVRTGKGAQEEELFRRTNYDNCCNQRLYPLNDDEYEFVVTENVYIVKDFNNKLIPVSEWNSFTFIAMPAVRNPRLMPKHEQVKTYHDQKDYETMRKKIDLIFRYAVLEEADSLVLGALGCGAFGNPPEDVAQIFADAIETYGAAFKKIRFAILSSEKDQKVQIFHNTLFKRPFTIEQ